MPAARPVWVRVWYEARRRPVVSQTVFLVDRLGRITVADQLEEQENADSLFTYPMLAA